MEYFTKGKSIFYLSIYLANLLTIFRLSFGFQDKFEIGLFNIYSIYISGILKHFCIIFVKYLWKFKSSIPVADIVVVLPSQLLL